LLDDRVYAHVNHKEAIRASFRCRTLTALVIGITAMSVHATPIEGTADLSFGQVELSFGEVDWNIPFNPGLDLFLTTYGFFLTDGATNTGSFAAPAMAGQTIGTVQDISSNPVDANYISAGFTPEFIRFHAQPGWLFVMDFVSPGDFAGTPFSLTNVGSNVSAQLTVSGWACDTGGDLLCDLGDDRSTWTGNFFVTYMNTSVAELTDTVLGGGRLPNSNWTAQIVVATADAPAQVPEPSTVPLVGLALAGLGLARSRKA
jgi:hypothetical protein